MELTKEQLSTLTVVRFQEKRLDVVNSRDLKTELLAILDGGAKSLGLDMSSVQFIDSSGLGALVAAVKRLGPEGKIAMWGLSAPAKSVLELTQLYKVFDIYEMESDALSGLR